MNGPQKTHLLPPVLKWIAGVCAVFLVALAFWPPTVGGMPLNEAELSRPMDRLKAGEYAYFYLWLGVDSVFALLYTVLLTWLLRWRAADAGDIWGFWGRFLSWVTAFAVLFDLTENAILWTAASTASTEVSPWLHHLVYLKWLSVVSVVLFLGAGTLFRGWPRDARQAPEPTS